MSDPTVSLEHVPGGDSVETIDRWIARASSSREVEELRRLRERILRDREP
jgi:hypothetical protein